MRLELIGKSDAILIIHLQKSNLIYMIINIVWSWKALEAEKLKSVLALPQNFFFNPSGLKFPHLYNKGIEL